MRWPIIVLLAACARSAAPLGLTAQNLPLAVPLDSGRLVRLRLDDGTMVRGRLLAPLSPASADVTFCRYPAPPCPDADSPRATRLDAAVVAAVEVQRGTRWRSRAAFGAAVGAALGWLVGLFHNGLCDSYGCGSPIAGWMLLGAVQFGAWGALFGSQSIVWGPAQEGVIPLDSAAVAALAGLRPRIDGAARVRFRTPSGTSVLEHPRLVPTGLRYRSLTNPGSHQDAPPFELQMRAPATWMGMQVGAGVLGFAGALFGSRFGRQVCLDSDCLAPELQGAVVWSLLGAAAGAVIGGVVGSQLTHWRTIYRDPAVTP